jgi:hypothetical protein
MVRCIREVLTVALGLVFAAPSVARAEASCSDCCKYACIEARRLFEDGMQKTYASLAARGKAVTAAQFDDEVGKAKTRLAQEENARIGALPSCEWHFPEPGSVELMQWRSLGWSIQDLGSGRTAYGMKIETNMKTCAVRNDQLEMLRKIAPCAGFADATAEHENVHVAQCKKRGAGVDVPASVHAQDEVEGTAAGVKKLAALRDGAQQACKEKSCPNKSANEVADQLKQDLPQLKKAKGSK